MAPRSIYAHKVFYILVTNSLEAQTFMQGEHQISS
jgi:hypothetical protein